MLLDPIQYLHFRSLCQRSMEISTVQKYRQCLLHQCFNFCNISLNIVIGICLKIDPSGVQQKWFSGQLQLLRTHIGGSFQKVCFRSSYLQNVHKVSKKTNIAEQNEAAQKLKEQLFSKTHFVCLFSVWSSMGLVFFLQGYIKVWTSVGEKLSRIEIAPTFC